MLKLVVLFALSITPIFAQSLPNVIDCQDDSKAKECKVEYVNGGKLQIAKSGNLTVVVMPFYGIDKRSYGRIIAVANQGTEPIDVNPADMTMTWTDGTSSPASDADVLIDKVEKHQNTLNALATMFDQMSTGDDNAIAVDSTDGHSVAYDTSMAQERGNARSDGIASNANTLRAKILRRNTVHQNEIAHGLVLFSKPKSKDDKHNFPKMLTLSIGQTKFLFGP